MFTSGTEMTTAVTDLINGIICVFLILRMRKQWPHRVRTDLWTLMFALFVLVCFAGVIPHGLTISRELFSVFWMILYALMAFMMSALTAAIRFEVYGSADLRRNLTVNMCIASIGAIVLVILSWQTSVGFISFGACCAANMVYIIRLLLRHLRERECLKYYLTAILLLAAGTILQMVKSIRFRVIWDFNYNGVYHLFLLLSMLVMYRGITLAQESQDL